MSEVFRLIDILDPPPHLISIAETSIFRRECPFFPFPIYDHRKIPLDLFCPFNCFADVGENFSDSIGIDRSAFPRPYRRLLLRYGSGRCSGHLCDRLSGLDMGCDGRCTWRAERKFGGRWGFKWTAEIGGGCVKADRCVSCGGCAGMFGAKKGLVGSRAVEFEEPSDRRAAVQRKAFDRRAGVCAKNKGTGKVLTPQDAAMIIQMSFRAYLIRRSQAIRSLRELAVAKAKLKELRASFNNFSYCRLIACDPEERLKFSERIIVILLTVDAIQGIDHMVRASRRLMLDELEAMLDLVEPQPGCKLRSVRRKFNAPTVCCHKGIAAGVAEVVHMLDQDEKFDNDTLEACF